MSTRLPWIIKYRPKKVAEVVDQDNAKKQFIPWIKAWIEGKKPEKKAALLYGPAGCGKTSLVEATAKEFGLELIEMNASDFRTREAIERIAKVAATKYSLFGFRSKIILLDEIDGLNAIADRGALSAVLDLIEATTHPIVLTANDPWDPKLRSLRDKCLLIAFRRLPKRAVILMLKRICESEKLICEYNALSLIADYAEGDLRSAINDLQNVASISKHITLEVAKPILARRDRQYTPFEALRSLFFSKYAWQAKKAVTSADIDYETMMLWIAENLPYQYTDPEDLWRAYEALARADVYLGRVKRTQNWDLLAYVFDLMGAGVALARRKTKFKWVKYSFPQKILLLAKTRERREIRDAIAKVLAGTLHISSIVAKREVLPFLRIIFNENPEYAARIALGLNLTESMIKFLTPKRYREVLKELAKLKKTA